jgi:hypothetical protein
VIAEIYEKMNAAEWVAVVLGGLAFAGTVWSNYIAHKALKAAGKQRIAEFRKEWIESIRSELSVFLEKDHELKTCDIQIDQLTKMLTNRETKNEFRDSIREQGIQLKHKREAALSVRQGAFGKLLLNLNDEKGDNGLLVAAIEQVMIENQPIPMWDNARNEVIEKARVVFKSEWQRLTKELSST